MFNDDDTELNKMTILMVGNLFEGWYAYGPFEDDNAAQAWAEEQGWSGKETTILEMEVPEWPEDEDDEDEDDEDEDDEDEDEDDE